MIKFKYDRADTLIEVMFAITIFSLVVVSGLSIMNQGSATAQKALEISLVRQEIDSQAEALRFLNASYISSYKLSTLSEKAKVWNSIKDSFTVTQASEYGTCKPDSSKPDNSFVINTRTATLVKLDSSNFKQPTTFSKITYDDASNSVSAAEGIWIEAVPLKKTVGAQSNSGYIDFHIRACWDSLGQSSKVTLGTIVRLYEPR